NNFAEVKLGVNAGTWIICSPRSAFLLRYLIKISIRILEFYWKLSIIAIALDLLILKNSSGLVKKDVEKMLEATFMYGNAGAPLGNRDRPEDRRITDVAALSMRVWAMIISVRVNRWKNVQD
ncbi:hypothetical protein ACJX0J_019464, partial [Zea mays]